MPRRPLLLAALLSVLASASCDRCRGLAEQRIGAQPADPDAGGPSPVAPLPPLGEVAVPRGAYAVHVVDVGTGLAVFVEGPDFTMLYDGGSNDDLRSDKSNRLTAYLRAVRPDLRSIDHVVLSHAHRDHVELLADVIRDYDVKEVWEPGALAKPCAYQRFVQAISERPRLRYHTAQPPGTREVELPEATCKVPRRLPLAFAARIEEGASVRLGAGASMKFLHVDGERHEDLNDNSLVVRLDLGDARVLLPGDAEGGKRDSPQAPPLPSSVEGKLLARRASDLRSDVLVVAHHGSKTSTRRAFLDAVAPRVVVISSGPHPYATHTLPDPEVVELLASRATVLRTDADDRACAVTPGKIGRDADGKPGGCDNVRVVLDPGTPPRAVYFRARD